MVPADLAVAALVVLFGAASTCSLEEAPASLWQTGAALFAARGMTWLMRHSRPSHLEMTLSEGLVIVGVSWVVWTALHQVVSAFDSMSAMASQAVMTGAFLPVFLGGWR